MLKCEYLSAFAVFLKHCTFGKESKYVLVSDEYEHTSTWRFLSCSLTRQLSLSPLSRQSLHSIKWGEQRGESGKSGKERLMFVEQFSDWFPIPSVFSLQNGFFWGVREFVERAGFYWPGCGLPRAVLAQKEKTESWKCLRSGKAFLTRQKWGVMLWRREL